MTQKGVSSSAHWTREARTPRSKASTGVCSRAHGTRAIVIPLPPVRVSRVCSHAHGKQAAPIIYKLSRNKAFFRPVFGTATPSTGTSVASSCGEGASIGTLARGPSTEALLGQGRVPKGRKSVPLQGLWSGSRPGLARHPRLQAFQRRLLLSLTQCRVAKGSSIGILARRPYPQVPQWHPRVAKGASGRSSARRPLPQVPQWHPRGATVSWCIG